MTITLNQDITFDYVSNSLETLFNNEDDINLEFTYVFSKPGGIAYLSSLIYYFNHSDQNESPIVILHTDIDDIKYLLRADFFKNLDYDIEENFHRHDISRNMMECKKILEDDDPNIIDGRLKEILKSHIFNKDNLILGILLTTYEVTDNILEHSTGGSFQEYGRSIDTPGFISAQYYGGNMNLIEIGISDSGIGIVNSMEEEYPELSRRDVLSNAFKLNTSRHRVLMPTRGNGLAKLKEFVLCSNGYIKCRSNEFQITFTNRYPEGYIEDIEPTIGTHFEISIGCADDIDTIPIFNAAHDDYDDDLNDFFT